MRAYAFGNIAAILDAIHEITGYASGDDVITASRAENAASDIIGADGSMAVAISSNKSGSVKFKLLQTSSTNRYLNQRYALQEALATKFVPVELRVTDVHRLDVIVGVGGYLVKLPELKRGEKVNEQEWEIRFQQLWFDLGDAMGIGSPSAALEALG
jgi:hypothetical protein